MKSDRNLISEQMMQKSHTVAVLRSNLNQIIKN